MSNEEVVDYFKKRIPYKRHLKDLCEDLADYCCHKVSSGTLRRVLFWMVRKYSYRDRKCYTNSFDFQPKM